MTLAKRRLLYFIFIGAFCTITPLVILYANGYQLSFNKKALVKTGMLIVDTYPRNAEILLNKEQQTNLVTKFFNLNEKITTPAKIKNIIPGDYIISLTLPGYWSWEKKVSIKPGESTYAEDVILFKKTSPTLLSAGEKTILSTSPNLEMILSGGKTLAEIINTDNQHTIASTTSNSTKGLWSNDNKLALAGDALIQPDQSSPSINIEKILGKNILNPKWSMTDNSILFYQIGNQVFQYNFNEQKSENIFSESSIPQTLKDASLSDFVIFEDKLYLAFYKKAKSVVIQFDPTSKKVARELPVPSSKEVAFINYEQGFLNLLEQPNNNLHMLNFDNFYPLEDTILNIESD